MIYIQLSTGRGPPECGLAVTHARNRMLAEGPNAVLIRADDHSSIVGVDGPEADNYVRSWEGTILWVCADPLVSNRKRKNWYIGARRVVLPELLSHAEIRDKDMVFDTMRASGKGGQHVNKTETKVRLTHLPTGIVVVSEARRSQKKNKEAALALLRQKLRERDDQLLRALETRNWQHHNQLERGNPIRIFEGSNFKERVAIAEPRDTQNTGPDAHVAPPERRS